MELLFLGTGAGMPSRQRNVSSIALNLLIERDSFWLFDCGEGTQHQILRSSVKLSKTDKIFITHLHGDHLYGLPGLLASRAYSGGDEERLTIYGPQGIKSYIELSLSVSESHLNYEIDIIEITEDGILFEDQRFRVEVAALKHRIPCYGYRITELDQPGKLDSAKLQALRIPSGPIYRQLKQGKEIQLEDGRWIDGKQFIGPTIRGRIVTILGDTQYCQGSLHLAQGADVLVHEATFAKDRQPLAVAYDHATSFDAARTAQEAQAKVLIMTHISSRYQDDEVDILLKEAKEIHAHSYLAHDFWSYQIQRPDQLL